MEFPAVMERRAVVFPEALKAELKVGELRLDAAPAGKLLVETEFSVVSAGTELSIYRGEEDWAPLPFQPGYGAVGHVLAVGEGVSAFSAGDRVFFYGSHASVNLIGQGLILPVPQGLASQNAVVAGRMGQVAFTAVRMSHAELGDVVAVTGLGLVGMFAAQLMKLAGCTVIGIDISPARLAMARALGVDHVVNPRETEVAPAVRECTGGRMCEVVIEATGVPGMVATAVSLAGHNGQVVLLGTPRGEFRGDATQMLRSVHLADTHVTLVGAHEWVYPLHSVPFVKHSLERNVRQLLEMADGGRLQVANLISHSVPPDEAPDIYARLHARDESMLGVVFDWTGCVQARP